jgi:hypothetical protein
MDASDKITPWGGAHGGASSAWRQAFALAATWPGADGGPLRQHELPEAGEGAPQGGGQEGSETRRTSLCEVKVYEDGELIAVFQGPATGSGQADRSYSPRGDPWRYRPALNGPRPYWLIKGDGPSHTGINFL